MRLLATSGDHMLGAFWDRVGLYEPRTELDRWSSETPRPGCPILVSPIRGTPDGLAAALDGVKTND
jgi:hypothetical protein